MSITPYYEIPQLKDLLLEDSYLLAMETTDSSVEMTIEAALTKEHPLYQSPKPDKQYCYLHLRISFLHAHDVQWLNKNMKLRPGIDTPPDYGEVDALYLENGKYHIVGEWGELIFISDPPTVAAA